MTALMRGASGKRGRAPWYRAPARWPGGYTCCRYWPLLPRSYPLRTHATHATTPECCPPDRAVGHDLASERPPPRIGRQRPHHRSRLSASRTGRPRDNHGIHRTGRSGQTYVYAFIIVVEPKIIVHTSTLIHSARQIHSAPPPAQSVSPTPISLPAYSRFTMSWETSTAGSRCSWGVQSFWCPF